jgi:cob(I)alamin adenosyltransferase
VLVISRPIFHCERDKLTEKVVGNNPSSPKPLTRGLVQVFTGEGKGKTTAALGAVIRALGNGLKVYIVAFMKSDEPGGEWDVLSRLSGVTVSKFGFRDFTDPEQVKPEERERAQQALAAIRQAISGGSYDLVVLDEVNIAVAWKLVRLDEVIDIIRHKPQRVELILTGRYASEELVGMADLVTEMVKIKHPYDSGIIARPGIEY